PDTGLEAPASAVGWVPAPDAPLTADGAWFDAGAEADGAPADDGAGALSAAGADACGPSGAAAAGWDWPGELGAALLVFPLSEPPPHAVRMMAAAAARATILELRICSLLTAVSVEAASRRSSAKAGRSADRGPAGNAGTALSKYPPSLCRMSHSGGSGGTPRWRVPPGGQTLLSRRHRRW